MKGDKEVLGLSIEMLPGNDIDKMIEINHLQQVTNPTYLTGGYPTRDGLLSFEIFGSTVNDRKTRMAYIDLKGHYMIPIAAIKLKTFDSRLYRILYGYETYKLVDGDLVQDDEGETGPEYLYSIWDKVKKKEKSSILTKEVEAIFNSSRDDLFVTKLLVLPAAYRDVKTNTKTIGMNSINDIYSQIIAYVNNIETYSDGFTNVVTISTRAKIQTLLNEIYNQFILQKVKGQPSKNGFLKRNVRSKNLIYTSRSVIAARDLNVESLDDLEVKYGEIGLPLAQVCSNLHPFMLFGLKRYFDNEFNRGGKYPYIDEKSGEIKYCTIFRSYDEEEITAMIDAFITTPGIRFDPILIPENDSGQNLKMFISGRLHKENTTLKRPATLTDVFYIVAIDMCKNKYDFTTRYPITSTDSQFTGRVVPLSTKVTAHVTIGDKEYRFFPTVEGDPENAFVDTQQFSNTMLGAIGGDHDGDMLSNKVAYSEEANKEAEENTNSVAHLVDPNGQFMRNLSKEFILTGYMLTKHSSPDIIKDINAKPPMIII